MADANPHRDPHFDPTDESAVALMARRIEGPIVMVNLLRFREVADYSAHPTLAPDEPISGAEAYRRYAELTLPHLVESGGEVLLDGEGGRFFIGPEDEQWDHVLVVRQRSLDDFFAFATNDAYLAGLGHRTAALADSRLLPVAPTG